MIRFHWQAFAVYKNGKSLKMLIGVFCQKLVFSNVILAFLDYLKPKFSLSVNCGDRHRASLLFKISGFAPEHNAENPQPLKKSHIIPFFYEKCILLLEKTPKVTFTLTNEVPWNIYSNKVLD